MPKRLVVVFGLPGSGKSTLAGRLAERLRATAFSSDALRGELSLKGDYRMESIATVYREMFARTRTSLEQGESVVVDGSFSNLRFREEARALAEEAGANLVLIHMVADEETTLERVRRKREESEAGPEAYSLLKQHFQPVQGEHLRLDSSTTPVWQLVSRAAEYVEAATAVR